MKDRFWQVVYSLASVFRNLKEILTSWQDRILLAMKKPAAKVVVAIIAALFIVAFLTQGAFADVDYGMVAVQEQPDGSAVAYLSPAQVQKCKEQGGCTFVTSQGLVEFAEAWAKAKGERI